MRVLIACEESATVRDAFRSRGVDAWSCDILPTRGDPTWHYQCDVRDVLGMGWNLMVAHPDCTHLAVSGAKHFHRKRTQQESALAFVEQLAAAPIPRIAIENPVSIISTRLGRPTQIIQPWQFGDPFQKTTCLWLHWLPMLKPTNIVDRGEFMTTKSGRRLPAWYGSLSPGPERARIRSQFFPGIAQAMADQWAPFAK